MAHLLGIGRIKHVAQNDVIDRHPEQGQADHQKTGDGADLKAIRIAASRPFERAASAVRTLA